jgi:ABC-type Fe3+ transport system substrate-binding protein
MAVTVTQEFQANRPASSDVLVGYGGPLLPALQAGALERVDWSAWAPNLQNPELIGADGAAVVVSTSLAGIVYNTQKLSGAAVPHSLEDLLQPRFQGAIASTPSGAYFDLLASDALWGEQRTYAYVRQLSPQLAGLIRCNEIERIASGEFPVFALACSQNDVLAAQAKGQPVDFVIPADAPLVLQLYMSVPRNALHPNAAKLWLNYLVSREAQDVLYASDFADAVAVPGSKTARMIDRHQQVGTQLRPTPLTMEFVQNESAHQEQRRAQIQQMLRTKD